ALLRGSAGSAQARQARRPPRRNDRRGARPVAARRMHTAPSQVLQRGGSIAQGAATPARTQATAPAQARLQAGQGALSRAPQALRAPPARTLVEAPRQRSRTSLGT